MIKKIEKLKKADTVKFDQIKKRNAGFSLVELLIVITIIGILSTIVLSSVSKSRERAYDSKIKQQLSGFRTAAEIYFVNQSPNNYGPAVDICTAGLFANLDPLNGAPGKYIDPNYLPAFSQVVCSSDNDSFAVKASLFSGNEYWCVDNTGTSKSFSGSIGSPVKVCQ